MKTLRTPTILLCAAALIAPFGASAQMARHRDQRHDMRQEVESGKLRRLPDLVANVQAQPQYRDMQYMGGPEFDESRRQYHLKFLDGRRLVVVVVDGRTGQIVSSQR